MVVRLLGVGLFMVGALNVMIYWAKTQMDKTNLRPGRCAWLSIPSVIGLVLLAGSFPLAAWLRKQNDEEDAD